jgi:sirohydrochlorin ferrochelatase
MRQRLSGLGVSRLDGNLGVLVVAVGSSHAAANARTAQLADSLVDETRWVGAEIAFATGPHPTLAEGVDRLRAAGATRLVIAPWFLAHGRITDRVAEYARTQGIPVAEPLGSHPLVAATLLDRFDRAMAFRAAA